MSEVQAIWAREAPAGFGISVYRLIRKVWPAAPDAPPIDWDAIERDWTNRPGIEFVIRGVEDTILAHSCLFVREIFTATGPLRLGALAGVCVDPEYRGRGWGAEVVRAALNYLPELGVSACLFQTDVPGFYQMLGCRRVSNIFFDGTRPDGSRDDPFWSAEKMVFPADCDWPEGEIDINGPGF